MASLTRLITVEHKFNVGEPSVFTQAMDSPGFTPTSYRVVSIGFNDAAIEGPLTVEHNGLGVLGIFDPTVAISRVGATIDNSRAADYHSGNLSRFTITSQKAPITTLNSVISILIECHRKALPPIK